MTFGGKNPNAPAWERPASVHFVRKKPDDLAGFPGPRGAPTWAIGGRTYVESATAPAEEAGDGKPSTIEDHYGHKVLLTSTPPKAMHSRAPRSCPDCCEHCPFTGFDLTSKRGTPTEKPGKGRLCDAPRECRLRICHVPQPAAGRRII
jgi:hypothetical protein